MTSVATAESEESQVEVEIEGTVQLDVKPDRLEYTETALAPGDIEETSDSGHEHVVVENIGTQRLDNIYAEGDVHTTQPFGVTDGDVETDPNHNTANFVSMSLETANDQLGDEELNLDGTENLHYLNRVEFFEANPPEYLQTPPEGESVEYDTNDDDTADVSLSDVDEVELGRFRVGELNYFFVYINEDDSTDGDAVLVVGNIPNTPGEIGTFDFTGETGDYSVFELDNPTGDWETEEDFTLVSVDDAQNAEGQELIAEGGTGADFDDTSMSDRNYNLWIEDSEDVVARSSFNVDLEFNSEGTEETTSGAQRYFVQTAGDPEDNPEEALQPGQNFPVDFAVQIPNGVDSDNVEEGTITLNAEVHG